MSPNTWWKGLVLVLVMAVVLVLVLVLVMAVVLVLVMAVVHTSMMLSTRRTNRSRSLTLCC
jgi:hypothetical protein